MIIGAITLRVYSVILLAAAIAALIPFAAWIFLTAPSVLPARRMSCPFVRQEPPADSQVRLPVTSGHSGLPLQHQHARSAGLTCYVCALRDLREFVNLSFNESQTRRKTEEVIVKECLQFWVLFKGCPELWVWCTLAQFTYVESAKAPGIFGIREAIEERLRPAQ
jgi:hypothetical protein